MKITTHRIFHNVSEIYDPVLDALLLYHDALLQLQLLVPTPDDALNWQVHVKLDVLHSKKQLPQGIGDALRILAFGIDIQQVNIIKQVKDWQLRPLDFKVFGQFDLDL